MVSSKKAEDSSSLQLAACYRLLQIHDNANLETLDAAYFSLRAQAIKEGNRKHLEALKAARTTIKTHLKSLAASQPATEENCPNAAKTDQQSNCADALAALVEKLSHHHIHAKVSVRKTALNLGVLDTEEVTHSQLVAQVKHLLSEIDITEYGLTAIETVHLYGLNAQQKAQWKKSFPLPTPQITTDDTDLYSFNNRFSNTLIFPGLLLLSSILNAVSPIKQLLFGVYIWVHEFGHATVAWLGGHQATPLPFGWTNVGAEKSLFVYCGVLTLFGVLFWSGYKEKRRWPMGLAVALAMLQFYMTWIISADTFDMLLSFGGIGGEFYLSTLLIISFYFPLPEYWRWDFFRYPAVLFAGLPLVGALWQWRQIDRGLEAIPWGSLFGGADHIGGDMNQLSVVYGWSDQRIIDTYNGIGGICVIAVVSVYAYFFIKQRSHLWLHSLWQSTQQH